jgi:hypothetical protein
MDKIALKLQERLVQTCIDFINEHKDDDQVKEIQMVEFRADCLQESAKHDEWQPCTDSYCSLYGVRTKSWKGFDLNEGYLIDASY